MAVQTSDAERPAAGSTTRIEIAPSSAEAVELAPGDLLRVIDVEGSQVADLVAYDAHDHAVSFSQGFTRLLWDRVDVRLGDSLLSAGGVALLTVVEDTVGVHDLLFPPCNTMMYERVFGVSGKTGCREHLTTALAPYGIGFAQVTDPFNVFMHTRIGADQHMTILPPTSRPGDRLTLRAERELVVAVSACAGDTNDCNGGRLTGIRLEVVRSVPATPAE
ncbi:urea carboxylase-associated family protein [Nocardioides sp. LMS-CY]|uniref:DUF1989 domain-containing protein n=1 Tax=Nocardioides sp. (strain LMS-CY) TaxID=2840457 RepID=UPI001C003505|nr:urea carboxylase-associated family protein [Nocardioides sp. LMS-CY]QWF21660.1 urea carboxylase-associated family protein [Nocardioides sp. LMS-CY]